MDPNALATFQETLDRDGFDVTPGLVGTWNMIQEYCAGVVDSTLYGNEEPYALVQVPKSAQEPLQINNIFQLRPDEAVVLIGLPPRHVTSATRHTSGQSCIPMESGV